MSTDNEIARAFLPVTDEVVQTDLTVTGEIPRELNGALLRNGPNPFSGRFAGNDVLDWWPEAAMLHGLTFSDGKARAYRNRWVRTRNWAGHFNADAAGELVESNPNINVIKHAGALLALSEGGQPIEITPELETLGASNALGTFSGGMTAHPKRDPVTGELMTFRADWNKPWLRYGVIDGSGATTVDMEIAVPAPAMMHDMAITETHSILMDTNVAYDFSMLQKGFRIPIRWQDSRQSRLCLIERDGGKVTWLEIEPCFIQHVVNAYNAPDETILLDVVRYPSYFKLDEGGEKFLPNPLGVLWRYSIDLKNGSVTEQALGDLHIELPRINETRMGRENRYFYAVEQPDHDEMRGIVRYDLKNGTTRHHPVPERDQNSEPVFVPRPGGVNEDDGWLLVCVYRDASNTSEIRILGAEDISKPPLATIALDRRIPAGFHGAWITAD
ncbi:MAG: carotenoid oxygenase [Sneathiella sp.]|uniref:carotenoid oxygenase family protein n=1 Tax=Sneathiella sp. TaxID=1964365 RepID=UPI000C62A275|nr:carotenoid oxygenase family protein [Sneathiella sp.]MAZ04604.1 carotenoid oxygenase [Sneathiella sp.]